MASKYDSYQVICIGDYCKAYDKCDKICMLKSKFQKFIKGCNYSKKGDCKNCSYNDKCILIKPYSEDLNKIEIKRRELEYKNKKLYEYISEWDKVEKELDDYGAKVVTDVVYFKTTKQQMINQINRNKHLIQLYLNEEKKILEVLYAITNQG